MKHSYHIRCDHNLDKGFCAIQYISCACTSCVEKISNPWLPNLDKSHNHVMLSNPKYVSTLLYYVAIINGILPN